MIDEYVTIAPWQERQAALKEGKMLFYDGNKKISLKMITLRGSGKRRTFCALQGIYKLEDGKIIVTRSGLREESSILVLELKPGTRNAEKPIGWIGTEHNLGHMDMEESVADRSIGLRTTSKAERFQRSIQHGSHTFFADARFVKFFEKLGYAPTANQSGGPVSKVMKKEGLLRKENNLFIFHRIEAIDPKNGKAKLFTFPIKIPSKKER